MRTYTLHVDDAALPGEANALEDARLVRDGFSWGAFLFTVLWFAAQRLWLAALGVLLALVALNALLYALGVSPGAALLAQVLLSALIGLEANSLKRWTYERRGRPAVDVVTGDDRDEAEAKGFARWLARGEVARSAARAAIAPATVAPYRVPDPVIGFFPDAEGRR